MLWATTSPFVLGMRVHKDFPILAFIVKWLSDDLVPFWAPLVRRRQAVPTLRCVFDRVPRAA